MCFGGVALEGAQKGGGEVNGNNELSLKLSCLYGQFIYEYMFFLIMSRSKILYYVVLESKNYIYLKSTNKKSFGLRCCWGQ